MKFSYKGEGWGLTFDGQYLVMSDGTDQLVFRKPESFVEVGRLDVHDSGKSIRNLNELEWIDGEIWANVWRTQLIARINPNSGRVVSWVDLDGLLSKNVPSEVRSDLNGIAYDASSGRIFVTGKLWPSLFEIEVVNPELPFDLRRPNVILGADEV